MRSAPSIHGRFAKLWMRIPGALNGGQNGIEKKLILPAGRWTLLLMELALCAAVSFAQAPAATPQPAANPRGTPIRATGSAWKPKSIATLKASNSTKDDQFGFTVALSGDGNTMAVSSTAEDSAAKGINGNQADHSALNAGAVYVFIRNGGAWVQQAYVKASNAKKGDQFGSALALSNDGNTMAVGAVGEPSSATGIDGDQADASMPGAGAVYVFTRTGATWSQQAYVKASNTGEKTDGDQFGYSVAISSDGNTLATGAISERSAATGINGNQADKSADGAGAVYVYVRSERQMGAAGLRKTLEHHGPGKPFRLFRGIKRQRGHDGRRRVRRRARKRRCLHFHSRRQKMGATDSPDGFERGRWRFARLLHLHQR